MAGALRDFMETCVKANDLYDDKGVISVIIYPDTSETERSIGFYQSLDDNFKNQTSAPNYYAHFFNKVVLIYDFNKLQIRWTEIDKELLLDEVGDRVFISQTRRKRWVEKYNSDGSLKSRYHQGIIKAGGSPFSITIRINKKTGKVTKYKSV